jgi:predicted Zn finger-like uncharacterized protein
MNWITRCPECATVYQVSPDQLKAAKGWLRCGQCQHVFDSTGLILAWSAEPTQPAEMLDVQSSSVESEVSDRLDIDALLQREDRSAVQHLSEASTDLSSFEQALSSFKPEIEKAIAELATGSPDEPPVEGIETEAVAPLLTHRSWPSVLAVSALAIGLLGQWTWVERFGLSEKFPAVEPVFQQLCRALTCKQEFARDVSGLVIDTSSFIQRDDAFELKWILRNTTPRSLEMSALELTLQDAQGQAVVRRVFLPVELGASKSLSPAQVWQGEMRILVNSETPVTGYRVLSFYP